MRRKGKVHPSPSSSSTSASSTINKDVLSVLKLLPAAILTIVSVLSHEDRQVLAYMIARSIKSTAIPTKSASSISCTGTTITHKQHPIFHCECFDCYTSYWFRWDSSPNRELIHQAIEVFEEGEQPRKGKNKKKDKIGRRSGAGKMLEIETGLYESPEIRVKTMSLEPVFSQLESPTDFVTESGENQNVEELLLDSESVPLDDEVLPETAVELRGGGGNSHKGLARKVLPDVLGLFNSRLWNLWSPNV